MKLKNIRLALTAGAIAIASVYSASASAIPSFSFIEAGGFTANPLLGAPVGPIDYGFDDTDVNIGANSTTDPFPTTPTYSWISWGVPFGQPLKSAMDLATFSGSLALDSTEAKISTLSHHNNVIFDATSWTSQIILGRFIITDSDGGDQVVLDNTSPITLDFTETLNSSCAIPNPTQSTVPCDDKFAFTVSGLDSLAFTANDGSTWWADFGIGGLENAAFMAPNFVYTAEGVTSHLSVYASVRERLIPEPSTLLLVGLGLFGVGLRSRRQGISAA